MTLGELNSLQREIDTLTRMAESAESRVKILRNKANNPQPLRFCFEENISYSSSQKRFTSSRDDEDNALAEIAKEFAPSVYLIYAARLEGEALLLRANARVKKAILDGYITSATPEEDAQS